MRFFPAFCLLFLFFVGCTDSMNVADTIAEQPPYDKLTDSIRMSPKNPELYYHRGSLFYHNNQLLHAEHDLRTAWQLNPTEQYALSLTTILKQKNSDSAISFLKAALAKLPESISLQIGLARGYQQKNQLQQALAICDNILKKYPDQIDALLLKSEILKQQNKIAEALTLKEAAFSYAPGDVELGYDLAYDFAEAKNKKALRLTDLLLRSDSTENAAKAFYVKATYYANTGNATDAIANYNAAIRKDYNFLDAYLDKGELLHKQSKYKEALQVFELGQRISPSTAEFYFAIAKTQEAMGNKKDAKANYQKAYGLNKSMTEAKQAADKL